MPLATVSPYLLVPSQKYICSKGALIRLVSRVLICSPAEFRMLKLNSPGKRAYLTKIETGWDGLNIFFDTKNASSEAASGT